MGYVNWVIQYSKKYVGVIIGIVFCVIKLGKCNVVCRIDRAICCLNLSQILLGQVVTLGTIALSCVKIDVIYSVIWYYEALSLLIEK